MTKQSNDPLNGVTLKMMLEELQSELGWDGLAARININCFKSNPGIKSSLTFLRRTPWAREKLENLYRKSKGIKPIYSKPSAATPSDSNRAKNAPEFNPWLKNKRQ